jgi:AraC-like DNA-binding protein
VTGETTFRIARGHRVPGVGMVGYRADGVPEGTHLGVPGPRLTFILSLDGPVVGATSSTDLDAGRTVTADVLLAGAHHRATHVVQPSRQEGIQLSVDPLLTRALFGRPAAELADTMLDVSDLDLRLRRLWNQVGPTAGWEQRFALVAAELVRRLGEAPAGRPRAEVVAAWHLLRRRHGDVTVDELSRHALLSSRQLREVFRRELGVTPKAAARLFRLERALTQMAAAVRSDRAPSLAAVAADCGYADQAHLSREVAELLGRSPSAWIADERRNLQAGGHDHAAR